MASEGEVSHSASHPAPLLERVVGQRVAVSVLRRAIASGRVHHAYLFSGPAGVGKELSAFGLAQALLCDTRPAGEAGACGTCSSCLRAVPEPESRRPRHPDLIVLERGLYEPSLIGRRSPETQELSIDQVRTLVLSQLGFAPHEGRARVFVVRRADELSTGAANALLKTLEEPAQNNYFILITRSEESLLPTIRSRALSVRFSALPDECVGQVLATCGVPPHVAEAVVPLSSGSVELALHLSSDERRTEDETFQKLLREAIEQPTNSTVFALSEHAKGLSKDVLRERIEALLPVLAARVKAEAATPYVGASVAQFSAVERALSDLDANVSVQLLVESMLIRMRGARPRAGDRK